MESESPISETETSKVSSDQVELMKRSGVSPLIGTVILIAIVLVLGLATWGYANSAITARLSAQGQDVASGANAIRERFVILNLNVSGSDDISIFIYNNGLIHTQIVELFVGNDQTLSPIELSDVELPVGEIVKINFDHAYMNGDSLYVKAVGKFGGSVTYFQQV